MIVFAISCKKDVEDQQFEIGEIVEFQFGSPRVDSASSLRITFNELLEDSRCPIDANCIWSGVGIIGINVTQGTSISEITLSTIDFEEHSPEVIKAGIRYKLVDLTPYPKLNSNNEAIDYKASVLIQKVD